MFQLFFYFFYSRQNRVHIVLYFLKYYTFNINHIGFLSKLFGCRYYLNSYIDKCQSTYKGDCQTNGSQRKCYNDRRLHFVLLCYTVYRVFHCNTNI